MAIQQSVMQMHKSIPEPDAHAGVAALKAMMEGRSIMPALTVFHRQLGDVFRISAGAFQPVVMAGPEACRFILITARDQLSWRPEHDPVAHLLRRGLLMQDGAEHDHLRRTMNPALHRGMLDGYIAAMLRRTDQIVGGWSAGQPIDMLAEMRRLALLVLMDTVFGMDIEPEIVRLLPAIIRTVEFISPGAWVIWPDVPRWGYQAQIAKLDAYLYQVIAIRREHPTGGSDLISLLINAGMDDELIRDQLITMLIAGHDTSTALLSWALYLMGAHPEAMQRARGDAEYLDQVISETLRLYPPIHIGNRIAMTDLEFNGFEIAAGTRVTYSIYLTHRHAIYWVEPDRFDPERFAPSVPKPPQYVYLPFGGGPRNCIGMMFAQVEARVILGRLLETVDFELVNKHVHPHMGATLEPRPNVLMRIQHRAYQ